MSVHTPKRITGIGNALVDILINESDQFLIDLKKEKGGMTLAEYEEIQDILTKTKQEPAIVSGGAVCNSIMGISKLGGDARFIGSRGNDSYGEIFIKDLKENRVEPIVELSDARTGNCLSVVTPDAQRSMFTFLGASTLLRPTTVTKDLFKDTAIANVEGYLLFNRDLMIAALKAAKASGALVAVDLSSFEVVKSSLDILEDLIKEYVDILIANEDEALAFTGFADETKALDALSQYVTYAVLKVGERGSYVSYENSVTKIEPQLLENPVDTTGAGDLWAAGFLFGIANGFPMEKCGKLASACGCEVCKVMGTQIPDEGWKRIKALL